MNLVLIPSITSSAAPSTSSLSLRKVSAICASAIVSFTDSLASEAVPAIDDFKCEDTLFAVSLAALALLVTTSNASRNSRKTTSLALSISSVTDEAVDVKPVFNFFKPEGFCLALELFLLTISWSSWLRLWCTKSMMHPAQSQPVRIEINQLRINFTFGLHQLGNDSSD